MQLDVAILNEALPHSVGEPQAGVDRLPWAVDSESLMFAALLLSTEIFATVSDAADLCRQHRYHRRQPSGAQCA